MGRGDGEALVAAEGTAGSRVRSEREDVVDPEDGGELAVNLVSRW